MLDCLTLWSSLTMDKAWVTAGFMGGVAAGGGATGVGPAAPYGLFVPIGPPYPPPPNGVPAPCGGGGPGRPYMFC
jgi:hypothetical protein